MGYEFITCNEQFLNPQHSALLSITHQQHRAPAVITSHHSQKLLCYNLLHMSPVPMCLHDLEWVLLTDPVQHSQCMIVLCPPTPNPPTHPPIPMSFHLLLCRVKRAGRPASSLLTRCL